MGWEKEGVKYESRIDQMKTKTTQLKAEMNNIEKVNETSMNLKIKEVVDLQDKLRVRQAQFKNLKTDMDNKSEEVRDIQESLDGMRERAEKVVVELKKKKERREKAQTQAIPPVA